MKPHPSFRHFDIPRSHRLGPFCLKALTINDLDRDYAAVMESAREIKLANPGSKWPADDLTREQNMIDLAWHQREFEARRSYAWVIEDEFGDYLGCAYVYPAINGELAAEPKWWWRTGKQVDRPAFRKLFLDWLAGSDWPELDYHHFVD